MKGFPYKQFTNRYRNYSLIIVVFVIIIGFNSCCTKKYCPGADDIGTIKLLNFSTEDVDSVFLVYYTKDSEFKVVTDSFMIGAYQPMGSDKFYIYPGRNMSVDFDYRLYFTFIGKTYEITDFKTGKSVCNDCFLSTDYYTSLDAYKVNGNLKNSQILQIDKLTD